MKVGGTGLTAFLLSIPEALAYLFLNFSLFGIDWTRFKKRIVTFIFLVSLFMNLLLLFKVPIELSVVANIVFNMLLFKKLFPFSWSVAALMEPLPVCRSYHGGEYDDPFQRVLLLIIKRSYWNIRCVSC